MAARAKGRWKRRDRALVPAVMRIMDNGGPTHFVYEGACRAGLRAAFCLEGEPWGRSDLRAGRIIAEALALLGAERPTWAEGQPSWTDPGYAPGDVYFCLHCRKPMPEDASLGAKYCSAECKRAHGWLAAAKNHAQMSRAQYRAFIAVRRQRATEEHGLTCATCGKKFLQFDKRRDLRSSNRYCSRACRDAACAPRACVVCSEVFQPKRNADAKTCGANACLAALRRRRNRAAWGARECMVCGKSFEPNGNNPDQSYCSTKCANVRWRGVPGGSARKADKLGISEGPVPAMLCEAV